MTHATAQAFDVLGKGGTPVSICALRTAASEPSWGVATMYVHLVRYVINGPISA